MNEPYVDFAAASRGVLAFLQTQVPLGLWMVTRTDGQRWIVLQADDRGYGIKPGDVLPYAESLCAQRLAGETPDIAPDVDQVAAYRDAPARKRAPIRAYISLPLVLDTGQAFGTLCALDPAPQQPELQRHQALLTLLARQLATILHFDLAREDAWREATLARAVAETDLLTGCLNRRGWEQHCEREEQRCRDLGAALCVLVVDLDGLKHINDTHGHAAGDLHIQRASTVMGETFGAGCILARTGGDEFAILLPNHTTDEALVMRDRLRAALHDAIIAASIGVAERKPYRGMADAWRRADQAMYADKAARKAERAHR
jgi:diguanylate cyclase (GGDEF)-like protein